MRLVSIEIRNFGIIKEASLQFSEGAKVIGLVGRYVGDDTGQASNRAGKTTVIEAIKYGLFGRARGRSHKKLVHRGAGNEGLYLESIYILDNGDELRITRTRDSEGKSPAVSINGKELQWDEAYEYICGKIGYTYEEYTNTGYFGQGDIHQFMVSTPKDKRTLLLSWLNQTRWGGRAEYSASMVQKFSAELQALQIAIASVPVIDDTIEELEDDIEEYSDDLEDLNTEYENCKASMVLWKERAKAVRDFEQRLARKVSLEKKLTEFENILDDINKKIGIKASYEKVLAGCVAKKEKIIYEFADTVRGMDKEYAELDGERSRIAVIVEKINDINGICPVLTESCNRVAGMTAEEQYGDRLEELNQEMSVLRDRRAKELKENGDVVTNINAKIYEMKIKISGLGNTDGEYFKKQIEICRAEMSSMGELVDPGHIAPEKYLEESSRKMIDITNKINELEKTIAVLNERLKQAKASVAKRVKLEGGLANISTVLGAWKYCAYMFGDRGIPNEYIKNAFAELEGDVNYILSAIQENLSVEFRPYKDGSGKESYCVVCGREFAPREKKCADCGEGRARKRIEQLVMNIHDSSEGAISDFESDSGGGQVLVSFAVRIALLLFKIRQSNSQVIPVVFDEIVGMLDQINRNAIVNAVLSILVEQYGIEQIFWVSHVRDTLENISDTIVVARNGNHSTVEWN